MDSSIRITRHPRARRLKLKVGRDASVEVVAPLSARDREIRRFLAQNSEWIEVTRQHMLERCAARPALDPFPPVLELLAIGQSVSVAYVQGAARAAMAWSNDGLQLKMPVARPALVKNMLVEALRCRAGSTLQHRLQELAGTHGLQYRRVAWRNQKTRWGSCSTRASLSLNVRLLFIPPTLADYVLIHELAHLEHPNHSAAFWGRVERMLPAWRQCERELKRADRYLPEWIF
ncbi:MAG: SprT family zinc-dependent metalloprotease [Wenzhouxiangellaceae bacterium]|nr:SprT family zinc-dependent metalloprotease [Wenzhouxiangellaceae bacterium]